MTYTNLYAFIDQFMFESMAILLGMCFTALLIGLFTKSIKYDGN